MIDTQCQFEKIPGMPISYKAQRATVDNYSYPNLSSVSRPSKGMMPGSKYIKNIWEPSNDNIAYNILSHEESKVCPKKWYPYFKGGSFRRWYGNQDYVVDYQFDGEKVKSEIETLTSILRIILTGVKFHQVNSRREKEGLAIYMMMLHVNVMFIL